MEKVVTEEILKQYYANKKVLVTGHTGFKGSWLSSWLTLLGADVFGYALAPEYSNPIYEEIFRNNNEIIADIRDAKILSKTILDFAPDYIFHLAAQPLVRKSYSIPSETFSINAIGTANLLEAVNQLKKKCTVVIVTTDKVYENLETEHFYNEEDSIGGYDPYSASKACTEIVVNSFRNSFFNVGEYDQHQKAVATARAGNVIGGGDFSKDRIIPDIVRAIEKNEIVYLRNPTSVRPWQHVLEPLGGYLVLGGLLNENSKKYSGAWNFGPVQNDHITVEELAEIAINIYGKASWESMNEEHKLHEAGLLKLDISKANNLLDWHPKLTAREAVDWTLSWYKESKVRKDAFTTEQIKNFMLL